MEHAVEPVLLENADRTPVVVGMPGLGSRDYCKVNPFDSLSELMQLAPESAERENSVPARALSVAL